jgi:hypothetical protein
MKPTSGPQGSCKLSIAIIACFVFAIAASGCASDTNEAATANDIVVKVNPIVIKEMSTDNVSVIITDLNTKYPIYAVSIRDVTGLQLVERNADGGILPGDTVKIEAKIQAPNMSNAPTNATVTVAGMVTQDYSKMVTKQITVPVTVLPDVRFSTAELRAENATSGSQNLEVTKGSNIYAVCSVKNFGKSNLDTKTLWVKASIENSEIGGNTSAWINSAMTHEGVSEEKRLMLHVDDNAPNGVTKVILQIKAGNDVVDEKQLNLRVKL